MNDRDIEVLIENHEMFANEAIHWIWHFFDKSLAEANQRADYKQGFEPSHSEINSLAMTAAVAALAHWSDIIKEIENA